VALRCDGPFITLAGFSRWSHVRSYAIEIALTCAICVMLWSGVALLLAQQRSDLVATARHDTENLARAFAENTAHSIDAVDQALLFVRAMYMRERERFSLNGWNEAIRQSDGLILQMSISNKVGILVSTNLSGMSQVVDLSDREHFRVQRDTKQDQLFISKPVLGRESKRWSVQFTRKVYDANGDFDGIIVASVDPLVLSRFFGSVQIGHGFVFLAGSDDIIRASFPPSRLALGTPLDEVMAHATSQTTQRDTLALTDQTGDPLILSFQRLARYGVMIGVAFNQNDVLADYRRHRSAYLAGGTALSMLLLCVTMLLIRNKKNLLQTRSDLLTSRSVMSDTLEALTQGIMMVDADGRIPVINRRTLELLGLPDEFMATSPDAKAVERWLIENGEVGAQGDGAEPGQSSLFSRHEAASTYERVRPNGTVLEVRVVDLADGRAVRTFTDITERHRYEARIAHLAHHDGLTGLANRTNFNESLARRIEQNGGAPFVILFLDLDHFKDINDTWGHAVGDQLLVQVAVRLRAAVGSQDSVARFGGDEFAILLADRAIAGQVLSLARRIIADLTKPYETSGRQLRVGVSIGIARYPDHGRVSEDLLKSADIALYAAKESGRGTCQLFSHEMDRRLQERIELESDLRQAIADNAIQPYFQPICDATSGEPRSYETLARWDHPLRGNVSPAIFIALAEEAGLIVPLGLAVLRSACQTASRWPGDIGLTVNVSPIQLLNSDFEMSVLDILRETGLAPRRLGLEITEGVLIGNGEVVAAALQRLQRYGIRILLDDFGTGHAGLSYLVRFGFDCIKIDGSFVARMLDDKAAQAVIRATLVLSQELQLDVVAEGVETPEQLALLQSLGCHKIQGYLHGRPRPDWYEPCADQTGVGSRYG
jgi:diguanylate cyclase (GGDEF)-like protein